MQNLSKTHCVQQEATIRMNSTFSNPYGAQNCWASSRHDLECHSNTLKHSQLNTLHTSKVDNSLNQSARYEQRPEINNSDEWARKDSAVHIPPATITHNLSINANTIPVQSDTAVLHLRSPSTLVASNPATQPQNITTVSPSDTHLGPRLSSPTKLCFEQMPRISEPTMRTICSSDVSENLPRPQISCSKNSTTSVEAQQMATKRKRRSDYAEPGSARAVYLEKNRQAASKCRGKQKRVQEELVEAARDFERENKILKAEVEILQSGVQDLMHIVGQHSECSDSRLRQYIQRESRRLTTGGRRYSAVAKSPKVSTLRGGGPSVYTSSPDTPR